MGIKLCFYGKKLCLTLWAFSARYLYVTRQVIMWRSSIWTLVPAPFSCWPAVDRWLSRMWTKSATTTAPVNLASVLCPPGHRQTTPLSPWTIAGNELPNRSIIATVLWRRFLLTLQSVMGVCVRCNKRPSPGANDWLTPAVVAPRIVHNKSELNVSMRLRLAIGNRG